MNCKFGNGHWAWGMGQKRQRGGGKGAEEKNFPPAPRSLPPAPCPLLPAPCPLPPAPCSLLPISPTPSSLKVTEMVFYSFPKLMGTRVCHIPEKILSDAKEIRSKSSFSSGGQSMPALRPAVNSCCVLMLN